MRKHVNIYKVVLLFLCLSIGFSCTKPSPSVDEARKSPEEAAEESVRFDPLDLPVDREIVPAKYPLALDLNKSEISTATHGLKTDSVKYLTVDLPVTVDSANSQAFRIQLFTSKVFGEGRHAQQIAEEIFDQPVYVDYEVPYYKVRVGSFASRDEAEKYLQQVRTAGYTDAWVVVTTVHTNEVSPLYNNEPFPVLDDSSAMENEPTIDD